MENALIAENLKRICKERNLSMSTLLAECGIRKSLIYDLEKRDYTPSISIMETLANRLNTSIDELVGRAPSITYGDVKGNNSGNSMNSGNTGVSGNHENTNSTFGTETCSKEAIEIDRMLSQLSFKDRAELMMHICDFFEKHKV